MNTERLTWERVSVDFIRSAGGRFDIFFSHLEQLWKAHDSERAKPCPYLPLAEAQLWCQRQA